MGLVKDVIFKGGKWILKGSDDAAEAAAETAGKTARKGILKGTVDAADSLFRLGAYGYVGTSLLSGKGLIDIGGTAVLGNERMKKMDQDGVAGMLNGMAFGQNNADKSIVSNVVDTVGGNGTAQRISHAGGQFVDGVQDAYHSGREMISGAFAPQGGELMQSQYPQDPFMQYNPSQQQPQGLYQQNTPVGPFQGINSYIENMTGGKMGAMDAAALMAAAYMMFGSRFGWMGKVASMLIGGYTVKDMQQRRQAMQMGTMQSPMQQAQPQYAVPQYNPQTDNEEMAQEQVVTRMRR